MKEVSFAIEGGLHRRFLTLLQTEFLNAICLNAGSDTYQQRKVYEM